MSNTDKNLYSLYFEITDLWKRLCQEHTLLLDKTFEEYSKLLSSDIEEMMDILDEKNKIVSRITLLEHLREKKITTLNSYLKENGKNEVKSVSELLKVMADFEKSSEQKHLSRFNSLLIDIIEKIQNQNKKNQFFLNKAMNNINEIKDELLGMKSYSTYNDKGYSNRHTR